VLFLPQCTMIPNLCGLCPHFGFLDPLQKVLACLLDEAEWTKVLPTLGVALRSSDRAGISATGLESVLMPCPRRSDAKIVRRAASS
jgi:hypothetical protein